MCAQHRRDVLTKVRDRLAADRPVVLVSTQLIEAGVDLDFPVVYRALAPADSLQQAAGRANREGRRDDGLVVVFDPVDGQMPNDYRPKVALTSAYFGPGRADPDNLEALDRYYAELYATLELERRSVGATIEKSRMALDFVDVAEGQVIDPATGQRDHSTAFRLVDDDTISVVVEYGTAAERTEIQGIVDQLRETPVPDMRALRRLDPFTARLPRRVATQHDIAARCMPVIGSLMQWTGRYDQLIGIDPDIQQEEYVV
jgi:CRISPR-associated endonuclease/helicase Cas3